MTRRRWIATEFDNETATLTGTQAEHLARVLRATPGMRADVVAGDRVFQAVIEEVSESSVRFRLEEEITADAALPMTLVLAVFKFDRMEWAIEKATELGVATILPVITRRTEKHLAQAAATRVERWRRIALEATQQSRGSSVTEIATPRPLAEVLNEAARNDDTRIVLSEHESSRSLTDCLMHLSGSVRTRAVTLAVGPEGGWTSEEAEHFAASGWTAATLGPRILRAETAVIAGVAIARAMLMTADSAVDQPRSI